MKASFLYAGAIAYFCVLACRPSAESPTKAATALAPDEVYVAVREQDLASWPALKNFPSVYISEMQSQSDGRFDLVILEDSSQSSALSIAGKTPPPSLLKQIAEDLTGKGVIAKTPSTIDVALTKSAKWTWGEGDLSGSKLTMGEGDLAFPPLLKHTSELDQIKSDVALKADIQLRELEKAAIDDPPNPWGSSLGQAVKLSTGKAEIQALLGDADFIKVIKAKKTVMDEIDNLGGEITNRLSKRRHPIVKDVVENLKKRGANVEYQTLPGGRTYLSKIDYTNEKNGGDKMGLIVFTDSSKDSNLAFDDIDRDLLYSISLEHSLMFRRVRSISEIKNVINLETDGKIDFLMIGGHGSQHVLELSAGQQIGRQNGAELDFLDKVKPGGFICLNSCLVGSREGYDSDNLVQHIADLAPGRLVVGPTKAISKDPHIDSVSPLIMTFRDADTKANISFKSLRPHPAIDLQDILLTKAIESHRKMADPDLRSLGRDIDNRGQERLTDLALMYKGKVTMPYVFDFESAKWRVGEGAELANFVREHPYLYSSSAYMAARKVRFESHSFLYDNSATGIRKSSSENAMDLLNATHLLLKKTDQPFKLEMRYLSDPRAMQLDQPINYDDFSNIPISGYIFKEVNLRDAHISVKLLLDHAGRTNREPPKSIEVEVIDNENAADLIPYMTYKIKTVWPETKVDIRHKVKATPAN